MLEAFVVAVIVVSGLGTVTATLGPHVEPPAKERVAVVSPTTGKVLYYNFKQ